MSWKPIPQEAPASDCICKATKTHVSPRVKERLLYAKKRNKNLKLSQRLYQSVSLRLVSYIEKETKHSKCEIDHLIEDMQKIVSNLQKRRLFLIDKKTRKGKKKKS